MRQFVDFMQDECGQGLTEYGLILVLASIVAVALLKVIAAATASAYEDADLLNALSSR